MKLLYFITTILAFFSIYGFFEMFQVENHPLSIEIGIVTLITLLFIALIVILRINKFMNGKSYITYELSSDVILVLMFWSVIWGALFIYSIFAIEGLCNKKVLQVLLVDFFISLFSMFLILGLINIISSITKKRLENKYTRIIDRELNIFYYNFEKSCEIPKYNYDFKEKAIAIIDLILAVQPNLHELVISRAKYLESLEFHKDAIDDYNSAIKIMEQKTIKSPLISSINENKIYGYLGLIYYKMCDFNMAKSCFSRAEYDSRYAIMMSISEEEKKKKIRLIEQEKILRRNEEEFKKKLTDKDILQFESCCSGILKILSNEISKQPKNKKLNSVYEETKNRINQLQIFNCS